MNKLSKKIAVSAALIAFLGIVMGAFGAHGLDGKIDADAISSFETGVRYQIYHALALLIVALAGGALTNSTKKWFFVLVLLGILLFSGSIYLLSLRALIAVDLSFLGPVTPIGGMLFLFGWLRLVYGLIKLK